MVLKVHFSVHVRSVVNVSEHVSVYVEKLAIQLFIQPFFRTPWCGSGGFVSLVLKLKFLIECSHTTWHSLRFIVTTAQRER